LSLALETSPSRPSFPDALALAPALARTFARAGRRPRDAVLAPNALTRAGADALVPVDADIPVAECGCPASAPHVAPVDARSS